MKRINTFKEGIKIKTINNKIVIKILFFFLLLLIIYLSLIEKIIFKIVQKKYAINYIKNILENNLNNYSFTESINEYPSISVIIPLYNCQNTIQTTIFSVQMQKFKNYEIILINDHSLDNTSKIINEMKQKDHRISHIKNKKNMGILYSRSIGALNSKGKYIFCLDNDDIFYDENLFDKIFNIAERKNFDIVEFKSFYLKRYDFQIRLSEIKDSPFNRHPNNYTLNQPKLGLFPITKKNKYYPNDYHIWGKSIKAKVYKKAINILSKKYYSIYNCWTEDISIIFIIFNIAQSFIFIGIYGIIHLDFDQSTTYTLHNSKKLMSELFLLDIIIKYIPNIEINKRYIFQKLISILNSDYIHFINIEHIKYLKILINKILQIKSLNDYEYKLIRRFTNSLYIK